MFYFFWNCQVDPFTAQWGATDANVGEHIYGFEDKAAHLEIRFSVCLNLLSFGCQCFLSLVFVLCYGCLDYYSCERYIHKWEINIFVLLYFFVFL